MLVVTWMQGWYAWYNQTVMYGGIPSGPNKLMPQIKWFNVWDVATGQIAERVANHTWLADRLINGSCWGAFPVVLAAYNTDYTRSRPYQDACERNQTLCILPASTDLNCFICPTPASADCSARNRKP